MRRPGRVVMWGSWAAASAALVFSGCGGAAKDHDRVPSGTTLTIYSSLPFTGPLRTQGTNVREAEQLALSDHHDAVGGFGIRAIWLDDATTKKDGWDPAAVAANARQAADDPTTIAYLGELDSGASAVSIPVLNTAGILQVSPASTAVGLTQGSTGADKGEPAKYYPTTRRTFGRVMPSDTAQGAAQTAAQRAAGCKDLYVLDDSEIYDGDGLGQVVEHDAAHAGMHVVGSGLIEPYFDAKKIAKLASKVAQTKPDCVFLGVVAADRSRAVMAVRHLALPRARMFAPMQLATPSFAAALNPALAALTYLTSPVFPWAQRTPRERSFARRFQQTFHHAPSSDAAYGYEAMDATLSAIAAAGSGGDRHHDVIRAFFALRRAHTVIGDYAIDRRGDTTATRFAAYRIAGGKLVFDPKLLAAS